VGIDITPISEKLLSTTVHRLGQSMSLQVDKVEDDACALAKCTFKNTATGMTEVMSCMMDVYDLKF